MPVRFPKEGNLVYPLPPDYEDLTAEGQRLARVNALCLQETPEDLVTSWAFFRQRYLRPDDTGWYKRPLPSPPGHYQMVHDVGTYSRNAWAAPRAFAKSTVVKELALHLILTRPHFATTLVQATIKKYRKSMDQIIWQLDHNKYINDDFRPEFGETIKPPRGVRPWSSEFLRLPNGSILEGGSVAGALRGDRPDLLLVDDPEYDEDEAVDIGMLIEDFEKLLFKVLIPMLERGCSLFWIGTLISRQSFLYTVACGHDPRFRFFNRRVLAILDEAERSIWEEKWSPETIEDMRAELGEAAFQSERMNNPGSASERLLRVHPEFCTYRVEGAPEKQPDPLWSQDPVIFKHRFRDGGEVQMVERREPFGAFVGAMYRIITVDFIRKPSKTSDFACIGVWGFDSDDNLWVLDVYLDRIRGDAFIRKIYEMALRWKVKVIGTEAASIQEEMSDRAAALIAEWSAGTGYIPRVFPIKYAKRHLKNTDAPTQISKAERIAAMDWRFNQFKIKLPLHRQGEPGISQLWYQIENFTMDLSLLRYDDAVDTLAMHQYVVRRKGKRNYRTPAPPNLTELLKQGRLADPQTKIPYLGGADVNLLTPQLVNELRRRKHGREYGKQKEELVKWPRGPIRFS